MDLEKTTIAEIILDWYDQNNRNLPWRETNDPYKIWLSEIILQQTRVNQGLPYYLKFIEKYPTIHDLARASEDEILRTWQGLGYYSRARNLYKCAKTIINQYDGVIPDDRKELLKLPGIGPYTSAAIASLAFEKKEAVVDGNVIRVITRLFGIDDNITTHKTIKHIINIANELIPDKKPGIYNQAIMDFGALACTPKNPSCESCCFSDVCESKKLGNQDKIPFKPKKTKKKTRFFNYLLIKIGDRFLLRKRVQKDIWHGLFEFYLIESRAEMDFNQFELPYSLSQASRWYLINESPQYTHLLSHQAIICRFYTLQTEKEYRFVPEEWGEYKLYSEKEIEDLPKSILIDRYLGEKII